MPPRSVESLPLTATPQPSSKRTSECSSLTDSQQQSMDRRHGANTIERQRGGNTPTPTGSLNKRRHGSLDSPSLNRNPLKKLSGSGEIQRSNSPELPAVHFYNAKMQQPRPASIQVQNAMFDNLKSPVSPLSPKSTLSEGAVKMSSTSSQTPGVNNQPLRKTHSEPICKPPPTPTYTSPFSRNGHSPVYRAISPSFKSNLQNLQKVSEDEVLEDAVFFEPLELPQSTPPGKRSPSESAVTPRPQEHIYGQLSDCTSRPAPPSPAPPSNSASNSELDKFVTGIYREPIDRCHSATPSQRSNASSDKTVIIREDVSPDQCYMSRASPRVRSHHQMSSSSDSRDSATTPITSPLPSPHAGVLANINGKTMSLFTDGAKQPVQTTSGNTSCSGVGMTSCKNAHISIAESNGKPGKFTQNGVIDYSEETARVPTREHRKSYPSAPAHKQSYLSPTRQRQEAFNLNFISDDDKDSISSRPQSEHSSIVFLKPQPAASDLSTRLFPHNRQNILSYVYTSPYSTLDKFKSRSSDTINSISGCPPTPKFPVPGPSPSLTQLLQELTQEDPDFSERYLDNLRLGHLEDIPPQSPQSKARRARENKDNAAAAPLNSKSPTHRRKAAPLSNNFQIRRRQTGFPPRHCRSLDYIPSDLDYVPSDLEEPGGLPPAQPSPHHAYLMPLIFGEGGQMTAVNGGYRADHTSLSSLASSSDMSRSDPHLLSDSNSAAYESEYDNYLPGGLTSDEDLYHRDPVSDLDMFDDVNVDNVTVSDNFSMEMPVPRFHKKITQV